MKGRKPYLFLHIEMEDSVVAPPSWTKWWNWTWEYFANLILTWVGLAVLALCNFIFWVIKGRDPKVGTIVPRWDILDGMSPAIVNYIENKGFGGNAITAMSAALVSLAVKGRLVMKGFNKDLTLTYEKGARLDDLPVGEAALLPYAIALGVESNWSAAFAIWLNKAVAVDPSNQYQPHWNRDWHGGGFDRSCNFQESFQSNYASSMPPTSSSESSGGFSSGSGFSSMGGFSGGGGGGGGGGGW